MTGKGIQPDTSARLGARLEALRTEQARAEAMLERLAAEGVAALVNGEAQAERNRDAEERAAEQLVKRLAMAIPRLEQRVRAVQEEEARAAAGARLVAIARADGALAAEESEDEQRLFDAAASYKKAADRIIGRHHDRVMLRLEQDALKDRFGLATAPLGPLAPPAMRRSLATASVFLAWPNSNYVAVETERDAYGLRTRRSYVEVADTPSGAIIVAAGPRPWPELTEKQQRIVEAREQQKEQDTETARRFAAALPAERRRLL